jgi:hypothetical protein
MKSKAALSGHLATAQEGRLHRQNGRDGSPVPSDSVSTQGTERTESRWRKKKREVVIPCVLSSKLAIEGRLSSGSLRRSGVAAATRGLPRAMATTAKRTFCVSPPPCCRSPKARPAARPRHRPRNCDTGSSNRPKGRPRRRPRHHVGAPRQLAGSHAGGSGCPPRDIPLVGRSVGLRDLGPERGARRVQRSPTTVDDGDSTMPIRAALGGGRDADRARRRSFVGRHRREREHRVHPHEAVAQVTRTDRPTIRRSTERALVLAPAMQQGLGG